MKQKNLYFKRFFLGNAIALTVFLAGTLPTYAATETPAETSSPFRFLTEFSFKNLFKKNIEQKKESLEKNKDIRNKLIQEKAEKSVRFNPKKEEIYAHPTTALAQELNDNIIRLENITERLSVRIQTLDDASTTASTSAKLESATAKLDLAKKNISLLDLTLSQPTTTASTSAQIATETLTQIREARDILIDITVTLSGKTGEETTEPEHN